MALRSEMPSEVEGDSDMFGAVHSGEVSSAYNFDAMERFFNSLHNKNNYAVSIPQMTARFGEYPTRTWLNQHNGLQH